jgi:hypothetical protein
MPQHTTPDGQTFDAPDHVIAALKTLEDHAAGQAMAARLFTQPSDGPTAIERHTAIRTAQYEAAREGRTLPPPPNPHYVAPAPDLSRMAAAERWAHMRSHDQSTMRPWNPQAR